MPFYPHTLFLTSIINLFLGIFVFTKNVKSETNRSFAFFESCIAVWCIGMLVMTVAKDEQIAMNGIAILQFGLFFIFSSFFNFVLALLGDHSRTNKILAITAYLLSLLFVILDRFGLIISKATIVFGTYQPVAGHLAPFLNFTFLFYVIYGIYLLGHRLITTTSTLERDRIRYLFIGMTIIVISSLTNILLVLGIRVYPLGHFALTIYAFMIAYAIIRYRLMDIGVIVKKTILYSTLTIGITAIWLLSVFVFGRIFGQMLEYQSIFTPIIVGVIIAGALQPIHQKFQRFIDKSFFRVNYDRSLVIKNINDLITTTPDKKELLGNILQVITKTIPMKNVSIMVLNEKQEYVIYHSLGKCKSAKFGTEDAIIRWFNDEKRELLRREIMDDPNFRQLHNGLIERMDDVFAHLIIPLFFENKLIGLINLGQKLSELDYSEGDINFLLALSYEMGLIVKNINLLEKKVNNLFNIIHALGIAVEVKDLYTYGHIKMIEGYVLNIGQRLGLNDAALESLRVGSILHDVGKIGLNEEIIEKKTSLTQEEFEDIKKHPHIGIEIIKSIHLSNEVNDIILLHHERLNGSGYPYGLKGEEISLPVRIIGAVDAFVAMISNRAYRDALSIDEAINQLKNGRHTLFDSRVIDILVDIVNEER
ncbi:MAG: HD domain-containing phosphohydrolase [Candidatus Desantisbacteria bacterium]